MGKRSATFEANLSLLMERFPRLALLAPTWPRGPTHLEELKAPNPGKAEALYIYGMGGGAPYFQLKPWLRENGGRKLIFLEDDPSHFSSWLFEDTAKELLSDPQVHLTLLSSREDIQFLAEMFPLKRVEILSLPSRKGSRFRSLKLQLLRKTTLSHALYIERIHGYQPVQNFVRNLEQMPHSFFANRLQGAFKGVPAIVCGAGPSLQHAIPQLKTLTNQALLIAGGSTLAALSSQGILPHFGVAIDPNLEEYRRMKNSFAFEVPLLYSTRVFPSIFQTCNGPFGYMRSGIGGLLEVWMEEELGLMDPMIGEHLSPESISVTAICTAWAEFLGCNPILFSGVDLAYTGNKRYAAGVMEEGETPFAALDAEKSAADRILKRKDRKGQPIYTAVRWIMEAASLSHYARKHKDIQFINTTDGGLGFKKVPFISLSEAATKYLTRSSDLYRQVHEQIVQAAMPAHTQDLIGQKMKELRASLDQIIYHLEILSGKKEGSKPLAELELQDEMAMPYLFYDIHHLFSQEDKWSRFLDLALKYKISLS